MSLVGEFPGMNAFHRRAIRGPVNPMDKSTIVSIYPRQIEEFKYTLSPGRFALEAGNLANPKVLVVGPSSWWREIDEEQPLLEIPVSSIQIAESVVRDYCVGILAYNPGVSSPGLFFLFGEHTVEDVKEKYKKELAKADRLQKKWYENLVLMADALWARSNGNPLAISDDMRMAAKQLGLDNKDWLANFKQAEMTRCRACGSLRNPEYPVCPVCKAVDDPTKFEKLGLKFAE